LDTSARQQIVESAAEISPEIRIRFDINSELYIIFNRIDHDALSRAARLLSSVTVPIYLRINSATPVLESDSDALSAIPNLRELDLSNAMISNKALDHILACRSLRSVTMPTRWDAGVLLNISRLPPELIFLDLSGQRLSSESWKAIQIAQSLSVLDVGGTNELTDLSEEAWVSLPKLEKLSYLRISVGHNIQQNCHRIALLQNLKGLVLVGEKSLEAKVTSNECKLLTQLTNCTSLSFHGLRIGHDVFHNIAKMSSLAELTCENCIIAPNEQTRFGSFQQLKGLQLPFSNISNGALRAIGQLKNLQTLNLVACDIDDGGIQELGNLSMLSSLQLAHTRFADEGAAVISRLPRLVSLDVQSSQISDVGVNQIVRAGRIRELGLGNTDITAKGIEDLVTLQTLKTLDLSGIPIDRSTARLVQNAKGLECLFLAKCNLDDDALREILKLPLLRKLDISENRAIGTRGFQAIQKHPTLKKIAVQGTFPTTAERTLSADLMLYDSFAVAAQKPKSENGGKK
jgi:Leucine-rich repeat (LRR) protein